LFAALIFPALAAGAPAADGARAAPQGESGPQAKAEGGGESPEKPGAAQSRRPISSRSLAHLYTLMAGEPPLSAADLEVYISRLPQIAALDERPEGLQGVLEATGWSEGRLAYVCVKAGGGLLRLAGGETREMRRQPLFAAPTPEEMELIAQMEPQLSKAFRDLSRSSRDGGQRRARSQPPRQKGP
jgi:hypothetical protein